MNEAAFWDVQVEVVQRLLRNLLRGENREKQVAETKVLYVQAIKTLKPHRKFPHN